MKILDEKFQAEVAKMQKAGEVSEPFESRFGFHIVRLVKREPDRQKTFDEAREEIIAAEKQRILDTARNELLAEIRNDPKTYLHMENVEALFERPRESAQAPGVDTKTR
jgi:parvulin-like peptidyl-prolyl isomerase